MAVNLTLMPACLVIALTIWADVVVHSFLAV